MLRYPVKLKPDTNGTILATFPDVPEAVTFGEDEAEALARAADALETALSMYISDRRAIPEPSARRRQKHVQVPALTEAKILLYELMRREKISKADLGRRLNVHLPQVDRLLDLTHASRLDQLEAAFRALGKRLSVAIADEAA
jgi:antitoxin HicB